MLIKRRTVLTVPPFLLCFTSYFLFLLFIILCTDIDNTINQIPHYPEAIVTHASKLILFIKEARYVSTF